MRINGSDLSVTKALDLYRLGRDPEQPAAERRMAIRHLELMAVDLLPLLLAEIERLRSGLSISNHAWIPVENQLPRKMGDYAVLVHGSVPMFCTWTDGWSEEGVTHWCTPPVWPQQLRLV